MGNVPFLEKIRSLITAISFKIMLWLLRMAADEYWRAIYEQKKAIIDTANKTHEF